MSRPSTRQAVAGRWITPRALACAEHGAPFTIPGATRTGDRGERFVIYPALVNAHDHLHLNGLALPAANGTYRNSYEWIAALAPLQESPAFMQYRRLPRSIRAWQGALKNLFAGTTAVMHHDPWQADFECADFPVAVPGPGGWAHSPVLAGLLPWPESVGGRGRPPVALRYGPMLTAGLAPPAGSPWVIHVAEGTGAASLMEFHVLDRAGCVGPDTVLVHGVALDTAAQDRLVEAGARLVWCPASNMALLGRTLDPTRLAPTGRLSLGTDSRLSGSRDLLRELRFAARCAPLAPAQLFDMVTVHAGQAARLPEARFLPGAGDCFLVSDHGQDPFARLLELERADIRAVVRRGKPAVADPDFAPWFADAGLEVCRIALDGKPKLCDAALLAPFLAPGAPELAGLEAGVEMPRC